MYFKYLNDKDPWMLAEDIPDINFFFSQIWQSCFTNEFKLPSERAYKKVLSIHRGYHLWFYYGERDSFEVGENIVKKFIKNPKFASQVNKTIIEEADRLRKYSEGLPETNLNKFTNKELWQFFQKHDAIHTRYYQWAWIPVACDMFHNNLTNRLKDYLRDLKISEEKANEHFVLLTQPTKKSLIQMEQEEFLQIVSKIQADKKEEKIFRDLYRAFEEQEVIPYGLATHTPAYEKKLEDRISEIKEKISPTIYKAVWQHYLKNFYVKFLWVGEEGINSFEYYLKEMVKFIGRGGQAAKVIAQKHQEQRKIFVARNKLIKKLKISGGWRTLFDAFGDFMVTKIYRRYAQIYAIYRMEPIMSEIAKRLKISNKQVKFMLPGEVNDALLRGKINRQELVERTRFCVYYTEKGAEEVFIGQKAKELAKETERREMKQVDEFKGQTGCLGKAKGIVKIIIRPGDMVKMKKGDVLVSIATDPDIVPAMKKASAIITEQGGVTSHAAIVARELGIPCVIGTKIATKVLRDGQLVEVDANNGVVRIIKG